MASKKGCQERPTFDIIPNQKRPEGSKQHKTRRGLFLVELREPGVYIYRPFTKAGVEDFNAIELLAG